LDLSAADGPLVDYTRLLAERLKGVEEIILLHNIRYDFAGVTAAFSAEDIQRLKEKIKAKLRYQYEVALSQHAERCEIIVHDSNNTAKTIMDVVTQQESTLLLMAKKTQEEGMGHIPQKVLAVDPRRTPVLLVPTGAPFRLQRVLGALDLSKVSLSIISAAEQLAAHTKVEASFLHVYRLPNTYFPYIKREAGLQDSVREQAAKQLKHFLRQRGEAPAPPIELRQGGHIVDTITDYIAETETDLLLLGRIGKTNLIGGQLGSVARTFLARDSGFPICVL
jgi:nucleotide-binding universal stress UspA family protein